MENNEFKEQVIKELTDAIIDDFRGFLVEGQRIVVPDNLYHMQVALEEMKKVEGWTYERGTGQKPLIDYLREKAAIYITRITIDEQAGKYQRTVGYLKQTYDYEIEYKGKKQPAYEVIKSISVGMGYDVDEYVALDEKNKVEVNTYKGNTIIDKVMTKENPHNRHISSEHSAKPVFVGGRLMGFYMGGKFKKAEDIVGYGQISAESQITVTDKYSDFRDKNKGNIGLQGECSEEQDNNDDGSR